MKSFYLLLCVLSLGALVLGNVVSLATSNADSAVYELTRNEGKWQLELDPAHFTLTEEKRIQEGIQALLDSHTPSVYRRKNQADLILAIVLFFSLAGYFREFITQKRQIQTTQTTH